MFKLPLMIAGAFAESAQVRARILLRKTLIVAVSGGLAAGGLIFLISAAHLALAEAVGPVFASCVIGGIMVGAGIAVFFYFRRNLEQPTPDAGNPLQTAAAVAADPSLSSAKSDASRVRSNVAQPLDSSGRSTLSPAESAIHAAATGDYSEAIAHATTVGRQLGKQIPPMAIPVAGLAIGVVLASLMNKRDE